MYGFDGERLRDDILSVFDGPYVGEKRQHSMRRKRNHVCYFSLLLNTT